MQSTLEQINIQRANFDSLGHSYPANSSVEISTEPIKGVTCYWLTPDGYDKNRIALYLHGGMFVLGSMEGYKAMVSYFASSSSTRILFVDYPLAPENSFPVAVNDIFTVYQDIVLRFPDAKITIMGDSAGGTLSATLIKMASEKKLKMPSSVILISPWVNLKCDTESHETRKALDPVLTKDQLLEYAGYYAGDHWNEADPSQFTFDSFPPLLILVGSNEILFDDSKLFYSKIKQLQSITQMKEFENQHHGWPLIDITSDASQDALTMMEKFIANTSKL